MAATTRIGWRWTSVALLLSTVSTMLAAQGKRKEAHPQTAAPYAADNHPGPAWFVDVAAQAGLTMQNVNGEAATKQNILETTGGGVAVIDYDHDGWPDILLLNGDSMERSSSKAAHPISHLYRNQHDGTFADVTVAAGLPAAGWAQGACVGDYDNDGYDDVFVTYYGKNRLYRNQHDGTFKEEAASAGVAGSGKEWGTGCAFVDYDRDGKLDLLVANYVALDLKTLPKPGQGVTCLWKGVPVMCGPRGLPFSTNLLYRNLGNGKFEDTTQASGITKTNAHYCFSVSTLDYNQDGWPDVYVACDSTPSILYRNNHNGTFTDLASDASVAYDEDGREQAGMGSAVADYDGDGWPDLFKTNFSDDTSSLYRNNHDGTFTPSIFQAGLGLNTQYLGWGATFIDLDNGGWPSVLLANGHVYPQVDAAHLGIFYREPRLLYLNLGNGKFKDISKDAGPGCTVAASSRGMATGDFWNDGRISAVINNIDETPMLLVNKAANKNNWIGIITQGTRSNRDAIGARVTVYAGGHHWVQEVRSGSSYLSSSDLRLHFGIPSASQVERIEVLWPSGLDEVFKTPGVNRFITLVEGTGAPSAPPASASGNMPPTPLP